MTKIILNDPTIREALLRRLSEFSTQPKRIVEELPVHDGKAIADVVTVHKTSHCYEIKGEKDSISRIITQGQHYNVAFRKITLVTTEKHINTAIRIAPPHWGIILTALKNNKIVFRYVRRAILSPNFQPQIALLTLWRSELLDLAQCYQLEKPEKMNRKDLSKKIAQTLSKQSVDLEIANKLITRIYQPTKSRSM